MSGRERLEQAWDGLFSLFPDYRFDVEVAAAQNAVLLACGSASATHATSKKSWRIPAAWRPCQRRTNCRLAGIRDNKPVHELLSQQE